MDATFWLLMVSGGLLLAQGLAFSLGAVPGKARHEGRGPLVMAGGAILSGIVRYRNLPGEDWISWVAVVIIFSSVYFQWRSSKLQRVGRPLGKPSAR